MFRISNQNTIQIKVYSNHIEKNRQLLTILDWRVQKTYVNLFLYAYYMLISAIFCTLDRRSITSAYFEVQ